MEFYEESSLNLNIIEPELRLGLRLRLSDDMMIMAPYEFVKNMRIFQSPQAEAKALWPLKLHFIWNKTKYELYFFNQFKKKKENIKRIYKIRFWFISELFTWYNIQYQTKTKTIDINFWIIDTINHQFKLLVLGLDLKTMFKDMNKWKFNFVDTSFHSAFYIYNFMKILDFKREWIGGNSNIRYFVEFKTK